ncbi:MAG: ABC transporter substrate-binding protein [Candidatus Competibacter phosphatis]
MSKDNKTYTFMLRKDVQFHDGAEMTSEDVKATFDRIAKPPQGISIPRSTLFAAVSEITAPDKYTVQFKLAEPRPANCWPRPRPEASSNSRTSASQPVYCSAETCSGSWPPNTSPKPPSKRMTVA